MMEREEFSVVVLASDLAVDARSLLTHDDGGDDTWHDCSAELPFIPGCGDVEDFSDHEAVQALKISGFDKAGRRILRIVGKFFPATVISGERLQRYVLYKLQAELPERPYCIVYMHSAVQSEDNNPGMSILRCIYEELPASFKDRLQVVYFLHPGLRSRLVIATLGRFLLSGGLYSKIKYVSRLQYLWDDVKREQVEIPDFVRRHDQVLEQRPLTDYGIEPDPLHLTGVPAIDYSIGRFEDRWASRAYM